MTLTISSRSGDRGTRSQYPKFVLWDRSHVPASSPGLFGDQLFPIPACHLYSDKATIDEQLYSGDEAAVVRRKKYDCFGQFIWFTDSAQRHAGG
jgi:hypothetical protein